MSNRKNDIGSTLSPEIIEKYLNGELSHREMHKVEKLMLNSDFDAEAMEGFEEMGVANIKKDLSLLQGKLDQEIKPKKNFMLWIKIAASVTLLAITTLILFNTELFKPEHQLAESGAKEEVKSDTGTTEQEPAPQPESQPIQDSLLALNEQETADAEKKPEIIETPAITADESIEEAEEPMAFALSKAEDEKPEELAEVEADFEVAEKVDHIAYEDVEMEMAEEVSADEAPISKIEDLKGKVAGVEVTENSRAYSKAKKAETRKREAEGAESKMALRSTSQEEIASQSIQGQVISADDGTGLPGVNVILKGTTSGTITDFEGNYTLDVPQGINPTLVVSFIGLQPKEVDASGRSVVDVEMESDVTQLSEVVVTAIGVERDQRSLSYSVQTIDMDKDDIPDIVPARPEGGRSSFKDYLQENAKPINGQEGKVVVEFEVTTSGMLTNFKIVKSQGELLDNEAIRLIKEGPKWSPALRNDIPDQDKVRVKIKF